MACPFASAAGGKRALNELPDLSLEAFSATPAEHRSRMKLVIFEGFVFDVSADESFSSSPLLAQLLYADCTDVIMDMTMAAKQQQQQEATSSSSSSSSSSSTVSADQQQQSNSSTTVTFKSLDKFTQMQMKSDMLRLFCDKYHPIAKITP